MIGADADVTVRNLRAVCGEQAATTTNAADATTADAILVGGPAAGEQFAISDLRGAREGVPDVAVIANAGVGAERVAGIVAIADGAIASTSLKVDGGRFYTTRWDATVVRKRPT